jgi:hypothetical protein
MKLIKLIKFIASLFLSYCHLKVIHHIDTIISSYCGQDDEIISCHSDAGPNNKALLTYEDGVAHDPDNEELKNGLRRALDTGVLGLTMDDQVGRCRLAL